MRDRSHSRKYCLAMLGVWLLTTPTPLAAAPTGRDACITPQSTVVLLSGLPGDVESEKNYHDQLQAWLEVLENHSAAPQQVFICCDHPETLQLSATFPAQKLKAGREEFLSLGKTLAGQSNSLVVIVWGHGGLQGKTPVLHVRGPRLTAGDFKAFAAQMPHADSRWVLLFRGSGRFASELAAGKRQILASEKETLFNSDPVGMALVLKLVRDRPEITFTALGEELGRATAAWYEERHLARTEEPTLWDGEASPRTTSPAEKGDALAALPEQKPATNLTTTQSVGTPRAQTNLSAAWKEIKRVEAQAFPEADGVVLRRRINYTLGSNPAMAAEHEEFIQILTAEGKHFGDFDFAYSPPQEDIAFQDCELLRPDGKLLRLDPDAIREATEASVGDYRSARRKLFSLPGVTPGAVLHVRYQTEWKTYPLPYVSLTIPLASELPVVDSTVQISVAKDSAFHFAFHQAPAVDPVIQQSSYASTYTWHFESLPAQEREVLASAQPPPALLVSTFPDWPAFANWYARITRMVDEVTPELAAKAAELTRSARNDLEKVQAIYDYVTGLRYIAVELGVNSFRPHAAANVFQNQFGDCKDKANLFNTLLRSQNIDARLVLVPRFAQAYEAVPGLAFNHAISRVTLGNEAIWVDTTDDVCRFGMLPPGDAGRKVLVIDDKAIALTLLPLPPVNQHQLKVRAQVKCPAAPGAAWPITLAVTTLGYPDYELRAAVLQTKRSMVPVLTAQFHPTAGVFELEQQRFTPVSTLSENFTWQAEGKCVGLVAATGGKGQLRAPFWLPREWEQALHRRKSALFLNQGYPLRLDEEIEFSLPAPAQPVLLPGTVENTREPLRWKVEWSRGGDAITSRLRVELDRGEVSMADTPTLQQQLRELLSALAAGANIAFPAPP